jgi:hypothetical protein
LKGPYTKKRREKCVIFLDDAFDAEGIPELLLAAGYHRVERFTTHFPREGNTGKRQQEVKDPSVLKLCNREGWLLVTTDSDMRFTHVEEIKKCVNIGILATAHNKVDDPYEWVNGLAKGRATIERRFKKQAPPWYGQFDRSGRITTCYTVTDQHGSRRHRPKEMEAGLALGSRLG